MKDYQPPAIQNSTGICFYCKSKLTDVAPIEIWEVDDEERFIKVQCSDPNCAGIAWRTHQPIPDNRNVIGVNATTEHRL